MEPPSQDTLAEDPPDVRADGRGLDEHVSRHDSRPEPRRGIAGKFREQPVLNTLLAVLCIAAIALAATAIGPASPSGGQSTRTATVKQGVVQSTVSGSGNIQSAFQLNLGFKTSGTVTHIYAKEGQHVTQGQLLATLDPGSAEVSLEQAKATLQSAEANLAKLEETEGETTGSQGASTGSGATASTAGASTATSPSSSKSGSTTHPVNTSEAGTSSSQSAGATQGASSPSSRQSAATREANLASARAAVKSDKLSVQSAEQAVQSTKLYAPESGTIVSLSGEVGETVSGTGTTKASPSSTSPTSTSGSSGAGAGGSSGLGGGSTAGSSSSSSSQGGSSSSSFAVLSDLQSLQLVVALSESEINSVHVGQIATVTIEALAGRKVGAHVVSVSQVPTSSSGAVSYDVTFQLDQDAEGLKVGMSATAEVVVKQAEGLNVPTSAIKAGSVTVLHNGKQEARRVTTGLAGDSSTIVLSGLKAGEILALPTTTSSGSSLSSRLGSRLRGGGLGGGGFVGAGAFPGGGPPGP